jgi:hypothetical protein
MPTPLLLGGQEFIYFNENPIKHNYKISGKGTVKNKSTEYKGSTECEGSNKCNRSNGSLYTIIIQYLFYTIMLLNLALLYLIFDEINRKKNELSI